MSRRLDSQWMVKLNSRLLVGVSKVDSILNSTRRVEVRWWAVNGEVSDRCTKCTVGDWIRGKQTQILHQWACVRARVSLSQWAPSQWTLPEYALLANIRIRAGFRAGEAFLEERRMYNGSVITNFDTIVSAMSHISNRCAFALDLHPSGECTFCHWQIAPTIAISLTANRMFANLAPWHVGILEFTIKVAIK